MNRRQAKAQAQATQRAMSHRGPTPITREKVAAVRKYYRENRCPPYRQIAKEFGMSFGTICKILKKQPPYDYEA